MSIFSKFIPILFCVAIVSVAHAQGRSLPAGALREGTLANEKLIRDAKMGVAAKVAVLGCSKPETLQPFVLAAPTGKIGSRHWKEQWVIGGCGKTYPITIDFMEDGQNAAIWTIRGR